MAYTPYNFPDQPFDGQIYPNPPIPGTFQYKWIADRRVWVLVSGGVTQVLGNAPIIITGTASAPTVNIRPASVTQSGSLSAADKAKIDKIPEVPGTVTRINTGTGLSGGPIINEGTIALRPPSGPNIGGVKAGAGVIIQPDGTLESSAGVTEVIAGVGLGGGTITTAGTIFLRPPLAGNIGGVKAGNNITILSDGTINAVQGGSATGAFSILDDISPLFDGVSVQFPIKVQGNVQTVTQPANLFLAVGGILQPYPSSFIVVNNEAIRFSFPPPTGATFSGRVFVPNGQSFNIIDDISSQFNGVTVTFALKVGAQPYSPFSPASLFVVVGGIMQTPDIAYTLSGSNITFSTAPPAGASFSGQVLGI
jgi:hypothetical protein